MTRVRAGGPDPAQGDAAAGARERLKARFTSEDLDEHVHEQKAEEASALNNAGVDDQLDYLGEAYGWERLEAMLAGDDRASTSH